jgi:hypothetical protein
MPVPPVIFATLSGSLYGITSAPTAGQSIRANSTETAWELFTPVDTTSAQTIGGEKTWTALQTISVDGEGLRLAAATGVNETRIQMHSAVGTRMATMRANPNAGLAWQLFGSNSNVSEITAGTDQSVRLGIRNNAYFRLASYEANGNASADNIIYADGATGNVGIGTTHDATRKLKVNGSALFTQASATPTLTVEVEDTGIFGVNHAIRVTNIGGSTTKFHVNRAGTTYGAGGFVVDNNGSFGTDTSNFRWSTNGTARGHVSSDRITAFGAGNDSGFAGLNVNASPFTHVGQSSTSAWRQRAAWTAEAVDNTDASRKYRSLFNIYDTAAREAWRAEADGSRGYFIQSAHPTAPGDSMLPNSSLAAWQPSAGKIVFKTKDGSGTVSGIGFERFPNYEASGSSTGALAVYDQAGTLLGYVTLRSTITAF